MMKETLLNIYTEHISFVNKIFLEVKGNKIQNLLTSFD